MKNRVGLLLGIDSGMFLLVVMLECLSLTGLTLHEWIGFALCPVVLVHVVLQWPWLAAQPRRILAPGALRTRINCALNIVLLILVAGTLVSGVLSSHQLVPIIGESLGRTYVWVWVHDSLNKPMLAVIGLHLALNWNWLTAALRRRNPSPPAVSSSRPTVGLGRFVLRGAGVLTMACIAAGAMYFFYLPRAKPPETWIAQGARLVPVQALSLAPKRDGRQFSLPNGVSELELVAGILVVTILAGRYGFRLRL